MKNNILVVTPLYKIIGRDDLIQDSECIHTLIKYWTDKYNVDVLFNYINGFSKIKHIFSNSKIRKIIDGYNFNCDGVNVTITERQNIFPKQINGLIIDRYLSKKIIKKNKLDKPYKYAIAHLPSTSQFLIKNIDNANKKIAVIHQTDLQYLRKHPKSFKIYLEKNFDKVFCRSLVIYKELVNYNLSNLDTNIIYSGVNTIPLKEKRNFSAKKLKFLYVGKLIKRKNLDVLIKSLSKLDKNTWTLNVIGTGPMEDEYIKICNELNLNNIKFLGNKKHEDVLLEMENSDVFCMPSINETLGLVYLEAMSKGCITIGTVDEGIDGIIINGKNGYLVKPNVESLYNCISGIYLNVANLKKISNEAIKTATEYDEEKMSEQYIENILKV